MGGEILGNAVTVGSGVGLRKLYLAAEAQGKTFVGGTAATVVSSAGYVQGGGHSALSPTFGLAADNTLGTIWLRTFRRPSLYFAEFEIVLADGSLVTANEVSNPDRE